MCLLLMTQRKKYATSKMHFELVIPEFHQHTDAVKEVVNVLRLHLYSCAI